MKGMAKGKGGSARGGLISTVSNVGAIAKRGGKAKGASKMRGAKRF